ncbi:RagB/SusD family nutrient uptake outer membrane protein [Roseimarinus sediminis]|uniref:RagB/SusD family nutrient uptake outer membrane protein n=1 Tax=Roseimarinus sediminis TaxID=1610899 RepID=UPI003D223C18
MNKLKQYILIFGTMSLGLFSCSESFLDVEPQTSIVDQNFYKTIDDAEMALIGCYDGYQRTSSNGNQAFYVTAEVLSDNCFGGTGNTDGRGYQALDRFDIGESPSDNNLFNGTWSDYYAGIFRCNTLLQKMNQIEWEGNDETRARIEGETRFLRALLYFDLVRLFNEVPLILEPTTDNVPQSPASDTYRVIAEDLKFAAENITYPAWSADWAANNDGRATQWAAKAILARVYLFYTGYYQQSDLAGVVSKAEVLQGLEDVIANGGFALIPEYKNLWEAASSTPNFETNTLESTWAGRGNSEAVFTQKFNFTQDYNGNLDGNRWLVMMGMRNTNFAPYGKGWGACTVVPELVDAFESDDARKTASVIDLAGEGIEAEFDMKDQREYTGYTNKKYTPMCLPDGTTAVDGLGNGDFQVSQYQDFIVVRYADVLLMAAELGSASAQTYFDQVRQRAGLDPKPVSQANILEERRFEFAFEGLRYYDLLRQGLENAATELAMSNVAVLSGNAADFVSISKDNILVTKGFMQIPNTQITLSDGVLKQNPGWE